MSEPRARRRRGEPFPPGRAAAARSRKPAPPAPRPAVPPTASLPPAAVEWIACATFVVLALLLFDPRLFSGGDNAVYYFLGKALATGQGYVNLYEPGTPPHTLYPPVYPLLLVPVFWLFGGSLFAAKALSLALAVVALLLASRYLRARLSREPDGNLTYAIALVLLATNATFIAYSHWTLSEIPYLVPSLGALALAESARRSARVWVPAALLAVVTYLIRTAALPLCIAVAWGLWKNQGRRAAAVTLLLTVATIVAWGARNDAVDPEAPGYLAQLLAFDPYDPAAGTLTIQSLLTRVAGNFGWYAFVELPRIVWGAIPSFGEVQPEGFLLGTLLVPLLVFGFVRRIAWHGAAAGEVYVLLHLALIAVWPWNGERFLLPVLPLLVAYLASGLVALLRYVRALLARASPRFVAAVGSRWLALAVCALVALPNVSHAASQVPTQIAVTRAHLTGDRLAGYDWLLADYFTAAQWIGRHAPADAIVVSRKPQFTYFWSGRRSLLYPFADPAAIDAAIRASGAKYVIYDRMGLSAPTYLRPYLLQYLDDYAVAYRVGEPPTVVFRRRPRGTSSAAETDAAARRPIGNGEERTLRADTAPSGGAGVGTGRDDARTPRP